MKFLIVFVFAILVVGVVIVEAGLYPVALIDNTPIFYRTWEHAIIAAEHFASANAQASIGGKPIDFASPEEIDLVRKIKRGSLTYFIEDAIIRQEGESLVSGFQALTVERTKNALDLGSDNERAAQVVYGLSLKDYENLILLPQARRDVLQEALTARGQYIDTWLKSAKKTKQIRLLFVPYHWTGEEIE